jgi:antitoxin MazE
MLVLHGTKVLQAAPAGELDVRLRSRWCATGGTGAWPGPTSPPRRIPKSIAEEAGLHADAAVELSLVEGRLVVQPIKPQSLTLDELLRGITDENLPGEWDTGPAVGKEVW